MSELDNLLEEYCKCTNCTCANCSCGNSQELGGLEAKVRARLRTQNSSLLDSPLLASIFAGPELIVFWLAFSDGSITKGCLSPRRHDRRTNARHGEYRPYAAGIFR
jgi:hypothetical protein